MDFEIKIWDLAKTEKETIIFYYPNKVVYFNHILFYFISFIKILGYVFAH